MRASVLSAQEVDGGDDAGRAEGVGRGETVGAGGVGAGEGAGTEGAGPDADSAGDDDAAGAAASRLGVPLHPVAPVTQSAATASTAGSRDRLASLMSRPYAARESHLSDLAGPRVTVRDRS